MDVPAFPSWLLAWSPLDNFYNSYLSFIWL
jgi:hypothetical protein